MANISIMPMWRKGNPVIQDLLKLLCLCTRCIFWTFYSEHKQRERREGERRRGGRRGREKERAEGMRETRVYFPRHSKRTCLLPYPLSSLLHPGAGMLLIERDMQGHGTKQRNRYAEINLFFPLSLGPQFL